MRLWGVGRGTNQRLLFSNRITSPNKGVSFHDLSFLLNDALVHLLLLHHVIIIVTITVIIFVLIKTVIRQHTKPIRSALPEVM